MTKTEKKRGKIKKKGNEYFSFFLSGDQSWINWLVAEKSETEQKQDNFFFFLVQADMKGRAEAINEIQVWSRKEGRW